MIFGFFKPSHINFIFNSSPLKGEEVVKTLIKLSISKIILNDLCEDLIQKSITHTKEAMEQFEEYHSLRGEITDVFLVGSAAKMPLIQNKLNTFFKKEIKRSRNSEFVVALGAALQGGILNGDISDNLLLDALPFSLRVRVENKTKIILDKDSTIPTFQTREMEIKKQDNVCIKIEQNYSDLSNQFTELARFNIDLTNYKPENIHLGFDIDANGRITFFISPTVLEF